MKEKFGRTEFLRLMQRNNDTAYTPGSSELPLYPWIAKASHIWPEFSMPLSRKASNGLGNINITSKLSWNQDAAKKRWGTR